MELADITPEWIIGRMKVKRLRQADVAEAIGLAQHKLSKSLNGHRQFRLSELEDLSRLLCDPLPEGTPQLDPQTAELLGRVAALSEPARLIVAALVKSLEEAGQVLSGKQEPPDDHES